MVADIRTVQLATRSLEHAISRSDHAMSARIPWILGRRDAQDARRATLGDAGEWLADARLRLASAGLDTSSTDQLAESIAMYRDGTDYGRPFAGIRQATSGVTYLKAIERGLGAHRDDLHATLRDILTDAGLPAPDVLRTSRRAVPTSLRVSGTDAIRAIAASRHAELGPGGSILAGMPGSSHADVYGLLLDEGDHVAAWTRWMRTEDGHASIPAAHLRRAFEDVATSLHGDAAHAPPAWITDVPPGASVTLTKELAAELHMLSTTRTRDDLVSHILGKFANAWNGRAQAPHLVRVASQLDDARRLPIDPGTTADDAYLALATSDADVFVRETTRDLLPDEHFGDRVHKLALLALHDPGPLLGEAGTHPLARSVLERITSKPRSNEEYAAAGVALSLIRRTGGNVDALADALRSGGPATTLVGLPERRIDHLVRAWLLPELVPSALTTRVLSDALADASNGSWDAVHAATELSLVLARRLPERPGVEQHVLDRLMATLERNQDRMDGTLRDGFGRHPDYADHGRAMADARLLAGIDDANAARAATTRAGEASPESLTW